MNSNCGFDLRNPRFEPPKTALLPLYGRHRLFSELARDTHTHTLLPHDPSPMRIKPHRPCTFVHRYIAKSKGGRLVQFLTHLSAYNKGLWGFSERATSTARCLSHNSYDHARTQESTPLDRVDSVLVLAATPRAAALSTCNRGRVHAQSPSCRRTPHGQCPAPPRHLSPPRVAPASSLTSPSATTITGAPPSCLRKRIDPPF